MARPSDFTVTRPRQGRVLHLVALVVIWLVAFTALALMAAARDLGLGQISLLVLSTLVPAVLLTWALSLMRRLQDLRHEARELQTQLSSTLAKLVERRGRVADRQVADHPDAGPQAVFSSQRARKTEDGRGTSLVAAPAAQPRLALGGTDTWALRPVDPARVIIALHFPQDEDDKAGFDALRLALSDPRLAPLIRLAQDLLTRLSRIGIYMDELHPDRARPEFWRAFARGARGAQIAPLGGIRDRSCLALTAERMRDDPEFREIAHRFMREFDHVMAQLEPVVDDIQMAALAETRSARAFMLIGRVSGVFSR